MSVAVSKKYDFSALNVNAKNIHEIGTEKTGLRLLELISDELSIEDWKSIKLLDIGCGVRFTQTLLNTGMNIGGYCGIDIKEDIIEALQSEVTAEEYEFYYWHVYNNLYNKTGQKLSEIKLLPADVSAYNVASLISVFTHLNGPDSNDMLRILRTSMNTGSKMLFSIFIDDEIDGDYVEVFPQNPSRTVKHRYAAFEKMIIDNGWKVESYSPARPDYYINNYFVVSAV